MKINKSMFKPLAALVLILSTVCTAEKTPTVIGRPVEDITAARQYKSYLPSVYCDDDGCVSEAGIPMNLKPALEVSPTFIEDEYMTGGTAYEEYLSQESSSWWKRTVFSLGIIFGMVAVPLLIILAPVLGIMHVLKNDKRII